MRRVKPTEINAFSVMVITGGSSGIGKAFIETVSKLNPNIHVCNLSRSKPEIFLDQDRWLHIPTDLSQSGAVESAVVQIGEWLSAKRIEGPMLLVNNSGFGAYGAFPAPQIERNLEMLSVNVCAPVELTARLLPELKKRGGAVMNIASTAAFQPTPMLSVYGAGKAFLLNWTLALANEHKDEPVEFIAICPGPTSSNFFKSAGFEASPLPQNVGQTPEAVVEESLAALEKSKKLKVCGLNNRIISFFSHKLPLVFCTRISGYILRRVRNLD